MREGRQREARYVVFRYSRVMRREARKGPQGSGSQDVLRLGILVFSDKSYYIRPTENRGNWAATGQRQPLPPEEKPQVDDDVKGRERPVVQ